MSAYSLYWSVNQSWIGPEQECWWKIETQRHISLSDGWERPPVMLPNFSQKEEGLHVCSEEINHRVRGQMSLVYKALWLVSDSYFSWMEKQEIENCAYSLSYVLSLSLSLIFLLHSIPKHCFLSISFIYSSLSHSF